MWNRLEGVRFLDRTSVLGGLALVAGTTPLAHAQGGAATAQVLFEQGRDLLRSGNAAAACPKLAESQRLDPATGTLLALAMCHEAEGKLASAWTEFSGTVSRARRDGNAARERLAQERVAALRPRLSTLEVKVSDAAAAIPGLEVHRDGVLLGKNAWNLAAPADGAAHRVTATAPGKVAWQNQAVLKPEQDSVVFEVPVLADAAVAPGAEFTGSHNSDPGVAAVAAPAAESRWSAQQWIAAGALGGGAAALSVCGYFVIDAIAKNGESKADCEGNKCGDAGAASRLAARQSGDWATVFGVVGGGLVAGGLTLLLWGDSHSGAPDTGLALNAGPGQLSVKWQQHF